MTYIGISFLGVITGIIIVGLCASGTYKKAYQNGYDIGYKKGYMKHKDEVNEILEKIEKESIWQAKLN